MLLRTYKTDNKSFTFVNEIDEKGGNVYTIIVGKNGTGKSTLLNALVRDFLRARPRRFHKEVELDFNDLSEGVSNSDNTPDMIIAVSTSPFDKFPLPRRLEEIDGYAYLGLRDLVSANFSLAYMSKIIASLISSVLTNPEQVDDISKVLNYLGYKSSIKSHFSLNVSRIELEEISSSKGEDFLLKPPRLISPRGSFNRRFFINQYGPTDPDKIDYLKYVCKKILFSNVGQRCNLTISPAGLSLDNGYEIFHEDALFLIQSGILRLRDVVLEPLNSHESFSIKQASSGEQSVILSILGIASKIDNNSLICIDEPEVCLHPEWQEKYIQILISTFSFYRGCHFIIATHSPQIVSKLAPKNCYVLDMETGEVDNANKYINNSIDFQLATVFNWPGYKNEYLSRIALNLFLKIGKNKSLDEEDIANYRLLEHQSSFMSDNDPVKDLYITLKELYNIYG